MVFALPLKSSSCSLTWLTKFLGCNQIIVCLLPQTPPHFYSFSSLGSSCCLSPSTGLLFTSQGQLKGQLISEVYLNAPGRMNDSFKCLQTLCVCIVELSGASHTMAGTSVLLCSTLLVAFVSCAGPSNSINANKMFIECLLGHSDCR